MHLEALEKALDRLYEYQLLLKKEKCLFVQPSVKYIVDKDGLHATPAKVEAITKAPGTVGIIKSARSLWSGSSPETRL